jgi:thiol-disulfide isomerase/thioredoxin
MTMASESLLEFTDANFDTEVLQSDQPVLVDFWAEWCQPCRMITPIMEEIAGEYEGKVKVGKLDCDSNRSIPVKYGISADRHPRPACAAGAGWFRFRSHWLSPAGTSRAGDMMRR